LSSTPVSSKPNPSVFGLRPVATNVESPALHKNIGKHLWPSGPGLKVHSIAGGEKHPFVVVGGPDKLGLLVILRAGHFFFMRGGQQRKARTRTRTQRATFFIDYLTLENTPRTLVRIANT
jgi:hypothetical protein